MNKICISIAILLLTCYSTNAFLTLTLAQQKLPIRNINTGLEYTTIQDAINAKETLDGHTIQVEAGTYSENIIINKSITLIGQNKLNTILTGQLPQPIILITAKNVKISQFTIKESAYGYGSIHLYQTRDCNITENIISNSYYGIQLYQSTNNSIQNNIISKCEYGIRLYNSTNNHITQNTITESKNGIHFDISDNNQVSNNTITLNQWNGIYLYQSIHNTISENTLTLNNARGIRLHNSSNNNIYHNTVSNSTDGISLSDSNSTIICGNTISNNTQYGLRLLNSSENKIFHNNFLNNTIKNVEQPTNASIGNLWDNFFEGNYWSDHEGQDINKDGLSETPYITDQRTWLGLHSRDSYPLMGLFQRLTLQFQDQIYVIEVISNSTITQLQYNYDQQNEKENTLTLNAITIGNASFYRISIPHALVEPPYNITINHNSSININKIYTNGTHTWIYFENLNFEPTATITIKHQFTPAPESPIWMQTRFWWALGITTLIAMLSLINIKNYRTVNKQRRLLQLYEEKLQEAHPLIIARELFKADVESRKSKIEKFETKYGLKIQPRSNFEEIIKSIKTKQKENQNQKNKRKT